MLNRKFFLILFFLIFFLIFFFSYQKHNKNIINNKIENNIKENYEKNELSLIRNLNNLLIFYEDWKKIKQICKNNEKIVNDFCHFFYKNDINEQINIMKKILDEEIYKKFLFLKNNINSFFIKYYINKKRKLNDNEIRNLCKFFTEKRILNDYDKCILLFDDGFKDICWLLQNNKIKIKYIENKLKKCKELKDKKNRLLCYNEIIKRHSCIIKLYKQLSFDLKNDIKDIILFLLNQQEERKYFLVFKNFSNNFENINCDSLDLNWLLYECLVFKKWYKLYKNKQKWKINIDYSKYWFNIDSFKTSQEYYNLKKLIKKNENYVINLLIENYLPKIGVIGIEEIFMNYKRKDNKLFFEKVPILFSYFNSKDFIEKVANSKISLDLKNSFLNIILAKYKYWLVNWQKLYINKYIDYLFYRIILDKINNKFNQNKIYSFLYKKYNVNNLSSLKNAILLDLKDKSDIIKEKKYFRNKIIFIKQLWSDELKKYIEKNILNDNTFNNIVKDILLLMYLNSEQLFNNTKYREHYFYRNNINGAFVENLFRFYRINND